MRASIVVLALVMVGASAHAQPAAPTPPTLQVWTKPIEPFSFQDHGKAMGYSIDLWERVAREANLPYELHWAKKVGDLIDALKNKTADVGIAAISITSEREAVIDFTASYYESGLGILVNAQGQSATTVLLGAIATWGFVKICVGLILILLATANLLWFFERKRNPETFPPSYVAGVGEATWWALSTILSGGCEDKGLLAIGGRIIGALWMLICIIIVTYLTAAITTIMTVNQLTSDITGINDLPGQTVATVKGTTAEKYLLAHRAKVSAFDTIDQAFDALDKHDVKAVVYDEPVLLYHLKTSGARDQNVVGRLFERQNYGIGLQDNSPYRKAINGALLKLREDGTLDELDAKWFGDRD